MKAMRGILASACVVGLLLASGCAGHDRNALYQPMEPNYADPADPMQRQFEDPRDLDARGRPEAPILPLPEREEDPLEDPDPEDLDGG